MPSSPRSALPLAILCAAAMSLCATPSYASSARVTSGKKHGTSSMKESLPRIGVGMLMNVDSSFGNNGGALSVGGQLSDMLGFAGALGFDVGQGADTMFVQGDVLATPFSEYKTGGGPIRPYVGVGFRYSLYGGTRTCVLGICTSSNDNELAFRFPVGILYSVSQAPVDVFFEVAPALNFWNTVRFGFQGQFGVRFDLVH